MIPSHRVYLGLAAGLPLLAALAACSPLTVINAMSSGDGATLIPDLAYGSGARNKLDIYRPRNPAGPAPVVVFFYGGNWASGERADYAFVGRALAARGMVAVIADYRLYPEVSYPDFLDDSAQAVAWTFREVARYGGDPQRLFVMGHSAGAYNAAMIALDPRWLAKQGLTPQALRGWIGLAGPYDFLPIENQRTRPVFHFPDTPADSQPVNHATAGAPPALLIAARKDSLVDPARNTGGLARRLRADGVRIDAQYVDGVNHETLVASLAGPLRWLAILTPVVVSSAVALRMLENAGRTAALQNLQETAQSVSRLVDRDLYSTEASLQVLAGAPALDDGDLATFYRQAQRAQRGDDGWITLLDDGGQQLFNTYVPYGTALPPSKPAFKARARQILDSGATKASDVFLGAVTGRMMATLNVPAVTRAGKRYVLAGAFTIEHFKRVFASARIPPGVTVGLLDGDGRFLARSGAADEMIGKPARPELIAAAASSHDGMLRHRTWEGNESYDVYTHSQLSGWTVAVAMPVALVDGAARQATLVAALGTLAALVCAVVAALFFGQRHVREIASAAREAVNLGQGKAPAPAYSRVVEVNALHAALHAAGARLLKAGQERERAEAERDELLQREQRARRAAEQQNQAKDQFLAMLGHELRNPLAPISSAAHLLKMPGLDASRLQYASEVIARQVGHITRLVNDLLDVSRVTRGLVTLNATELDLRRIVADAVEQADSLVAAKRHHLELSLPPQPLWVRGDQTRLVQVLSNLLNNAAKYSPSHSRIDVTLAQENDAAVLTVRDNGSGIEADLLPRVFELFSQGEQAPDRAQGGLGLGLALVKSLVELHGGGVAAHSDGDGRGSCFTVRLPLLAGAAPAAAQPIAPAAAGAAPANGGLRVLVVDDNVDAADSLALLLREAAGYAVTVCHDGARALELAAAQAPQALILDIGLPDIDGYALARRLRLQVPTADALMIALTGYGQLEDRARAREAGFDYHLSKPADPQQILRLLALVRT